MLLEPLPRADQPVAPRRDAERNHQLLLDAATTIVETCGADALTMDNVAEAAGVGKGTVFRHFESRAGLMAAVLNASETALQEQVIFGEPPLGPGATPLARLLAFGRARLEHNLLHADLIANAIGPKASPSGGEGARQFNEQHVRMLLTQLGTEGDLPLIAVALMAPLDAVLVRQQVGNQGYDVPRLHAAWTHLVERVVGVTPSS